MRLPRPVAPHVGRNGLIVVVEHPDHRVKRAVNGALVVGLNAALLLGAAWSGWLA